MKQFYAAYSDPAIWPQAVAKLPKETGRRTAANLWRMRQLYSACTTPKFLAQAARELKGSLPVATEDGSILAQAVRELVITTPWGHHVELLNKVKDPAAHIYYIRATVKTWLEPQRAAQSNKG